jgi:hypothetical protein
MSDLNLFDDEFTFRRSVDEWMTDKENEFSTAYTPRSVDSDPTTTPTSGQIGEVVHYDGHLFRKHTTNDVDTNWTQLS